MSEDAKERFAAHPVAGPSYRRSTQAIAVAMTALVVVMVVRWLAQLPQRDWSMTAGALLAMLPVLYWLPTVLFGKTRIDGDGIRQDGMFGRTVRWGEIERARYSFALLQPRLVVSAGLPRIKSFHSGCRELDEAFAQIEWFYRPR